MKTIPMNMNQALAKLIKIGIDAELTGEQKRVILGGQAHQTEFGFNVYDPSFSLDFDGNNWILNTPESGQSTKIEKFKTLDLVIKRIYTLYKT